MTPFLSSSADVSLFLLTYLVHSSLIFLLAVLSLLWVRRLQPAVRVLIWKAVLIAPVITATTSSLVLVPHFGIEFVVATSLGDHAVAKTASERVVERKPMAPERSAVLGIADDAERAGYAQRDSRYGGSSSNPSLAKLVGEYWFWPTVAAIWVAGVAIGGLYLGVHAIRVRRMRQRGCLVRDPALRRTLDRLRTKARIRQLVTLLQLDHRCGPLTAGILRPFILLPKAFVSGLSQPEREALIAHELAHVAKRDSLWILTAQLVCRVFFFQPLNYIAHRQLQLEMEFVADWQATQLTRERSSLARCLAQLGEWLSASPQTATPHNLVVGMASFRSTLGRRVETLLSENTTPLTISGRTQVTVALLLVTTSVFAVTLAPRAVASSPDQSASKQRSHSMIRKITAFAVLAGLAAPTTADESEPKLPAGSAPLKSTADRLPPGMKGFNGMLVGRLAKKDVEKGTFILRVDTASRVWRNSKAEDPKSVAGKHILVDGVFGKWLDVLLLLKKGETLEFEARHDGGDQLTFPGELMRKVAPYRPEDYPVLPEDFRGFAGVVAAKVVKKGADTLEMTVQAERVIDKWEQDKSKSPTSIEGKQFLLSGFWNRREVFHDLAPGDSIQVGLRHMSVRSDHMTVTEFVHKIDARPSSQGAFPAGLRGFSGMLVGRLADKDVERGTFGVQVDAVPRVWRNNKADRPKTIVGKTIQVEGVTGKWLDVLLLVKAGETLEFEAVHNGGDRLTFPGEWMRKTAPVKPGDYPELPEDFRGFRGAVIGTVAKLDHELAELSLRISDVKRVGDDSRAKQPKSIIGHEVIVLGFWRHREAFDQLKVGDTVECALQHLQPRSDHTNVGEFQKVDGTKPRQVER